MDQVSRKSSASITEVKGRVFALYASVWDSVLEDRNERTVEILFLVSPNCSLVSSGMGMGVIQGGLLM